MKKLNFILTVYFTLIVGLLLSQDYEIYVSDAVQPYRIYKFDRDGQNGEVFIDEQLNWPQDIVFIGDTVVLISSLNSGRITKHDARTGDYIENFATGIGGPTRMKVKNDTLFVLQWNRPGAVQENVLIYKLDGTY